MNNQRSLNHVFQLSQRYRSLTPIDRIIEFYQEFGDLDIVLSSSFGANSIVLLHLISRAKPSQKVLFIDTGNHFPETLQYRDQLKYDLSLNLQTITACKEAHIFTSKNETWKSNPELCCYLKKVRPIEQIKRSHDLWISGLMEWQSDHRASLDIFEKRKGIVKFYPLIDFSEKDCLEYIVKNKLPMHPLVPIGYKSIGCTHCTSPRDKREGRWQGKSKTECGLHI